MKTLEEIYQQFSQNRDCGHGDKGTTHSYIESYDRLLSPYRDKNINFLEIGLGTNDISMASNMGKEGIPLASLKAWRDYFENANIYGADIDKNILKNSSLIVADSIQQCIERGEISHALSSGAIKKSDIYELGEILKKNIRLHCGENENSVVDLTGVAVQDIQIAKAVFKECGK